MTEDSKLLRLFCCSVLLLLLSISAIAIGTDCFLDSLTHVFACPAYSLAQFLARRDRFCILNFMTGLFAARADFLTGGFELATDRFRSDSQFAGSLSVKLFCDG